MLDTLLTAFLLCPLALFAVGTLMLASAWVDGERRDE